MTNMKLTDVLVLLLSEMQITKALAQKYTLENLPACAEGFAEQANKFQKAADAVMESIKGGEK